MRITWLLGVTIMTGWIYSMAAPHPRPVHYPEQLPGAYTGGFGEQTCHSCHFDYPLNLKEGSMTLAGLPRTYRAGQTYSFSLLVEREKLGKAGFQMSARFMDSTQAGNFEFDSTRIQYTNLPSGPRYIQHTSSGTNPVKDGQAAWNIKWIAPISGMQPVSFHISANAANGDASEFGDFIYVDTVTVYPVK